MLKNLKEKAVAVSGSVSGVSSVLGSWQVCHNICLGIIALLSVIGITITGMPLEFLTRIAVPLWTFALLLLFVTIGFYVKKKCISNRLIMFNSGLLIAGIPFQPLQKFSPAFWIVGGIVALAGVSLFIKDKIDKRGRRHEKV